MNERLKTWHPSGDELERILAEMKPIIAEFARKARVEIAAAARSTMPQSPRRAGC